MKKQRKILCLLLALAATVYFSACSTLPNENEIPGEARLVFQQHMAAAMSQRQQDPRDYAHYEGADRFYAADWGGFVTTGYIGDSWKKLTEDLWQVDFQNRPFGEEAFSPMTHYVGKVNGEFRVMVSIRNIPASLRDAAGLQVDPYEPWGNITPKAVFALHEEYLAACKQGFTSDIADRYLHFEDGMNKDAFQAQSGYVEASRLVVPKRLGYDLWAVFYYCVVTGQKHEEWTVDFVGVIDNQLKIMANAEDIPEELRIGIDFQVLQAYDEGTIKPDH